MQQLARLRRDRRDVELHLIVASDVDEPPVGRGACQTRTGDDCCHDRNSKPSNAHGATTVPFERVQAFVRTNRVPHEHPCRHETPIEGRIGELVASLVEDGATLQMGIGGIPDAVLRRLSGKHDLGVHTEMFSDGLIDLIEGGVITNRLKTVHPGRTVTSFVVGTRRLYEFVDDNPLVEFHPCDRTNDVAIIRKNDHVTAINSAIEIDLTGQICADSIGHTIYSGIGGQMDFMPGVKTSIVRERNRDRVLVEQDALSKFLLFSKRVHLLLEVRQEGRCIRFRDIAGVSFTRYEGGWQVTDDHGTTVVSYELTAAPAFAVPAPVLRRLFKRDSAEMVTQLRREIARLARYTAPAWRLSAPAADHPARKREKRLRAEGHIACDCLEGTRVTRPLVVRRCVCLPRRRRSRAGIPRTTHSRCGGR